MRDNESCSYLFQGNDRLNSLPSIDQSRFVLCSPTEVPYTFYIRGVVIEFLHCLYSETLECLAIAATIWEKLQESKDCWKVRRGKRKKVGSKGRATVGCGNCGQAEDAKSALGEVCNEITTIDATLMHE